MLLNLCLHIDVRKYAVRHQFVDAERGDFRLQNSSAAINSGREAKGLIDKDIVGRQRPLFDAWDVGAFESPNAQASVRVIRFREKQ